MLSKLSRRSFLQSAAAGAVVASSRAWAQGQRPVILYVGCYTARGQGIYRYSVNPATGELALLGVTGDQLNPSFLAIDPQQRYLYAANEIGNYEGRQSGSVSAFAIEPDGSLRFLNRQPTEGRNPAHISVDPTNRYVMAANYSGTTTNEGNMAVIPIQRNGSLSPPSQVVIHRGTLGPNQTAPHAHMVLSDFSGRYVLANDLGLDRTFIYRLDGTTGTLNPGDPDGLGAPSGAGPRHLAFHPNGRFVFILHELNSTLRSLSWDSQRGVMQQIQTISTLPPNYAGINSTAHVVVAPSGRFVYTSNRGHDSIALFSVNPETGMLEFIERVWTYGETPRNFAIDPTGNFMYVGHQNTDNIVVFRVNQTSGRLTPTGLFYGAGQPVCFVFLTPPQAGNMAQDGVTFAASPNPMLINDSSGYGQTTLSWNAPDVAAPEIRINSATGPTMGTQLSAGSTTTGKWVHDGMTFYLQNGSTTLATVRAVVRQA